MLTASHDYLGFGMGMLLGFAAHAAMAQTPIPESQCPQPRATVQAPEEFYKRTNPLSQGADLNAAERLFLGSGDKIACASCHGVKGDGRGRMSGLFQPRPRNFTCAATFSAIPDGQLFWVIRFGSPTASMPPHPKLSDEQIWQLVAYLRRLAT